MSDLRRLLDEAMRANDLMLWSRSGACVLDTDRALTDLAESLAAREVDHVPDLRADVARLTEARDTLAGLLESALAGMAASGHVLTDDGYCAACEGGCMLEFTNPAPLVPLVEPSPFVAKGGPR